jgi:hypothetical protein
VGDITDDDQLVYVNNVLKGKLLESETLVEQAANNTIATARLFAEGNGLNNTGDSIKLYKALGYMTRGQIDGWQFRILRG